MSINKSELDIGARDGNNAPTDLKGATPGKVSNILENDPRRAQIIEWINQGGGKAVIRHACNQHKLSERTKIYEEAADYFNMSNNQKKIPSDPEELYKIIFGKDPKYKDTIFHEIHNHLFPEEHIDFYMRSEEVTDWYNDPDEEGVNGKGYIEFGKSDNFGVRWKTLVIAINESRRNLGRGLLRTGPSTFIAQIPRGLQEESGLVNITLPGAHRESFTRKKRRETGIPKKSNSTIDGNTNLPLIDTPEEEVLLPSLQKTIPSTPGKVSIILDNDLRRAQIIEWINQGGGKSLIQQACKKNWYNIRKLIYQEELGRQKRNPDKSYILPSDPIDLYKIIFGEKPKYKDPIFHEIHNHLFPEEHIDFYMRSEEFTDWYNAPDENGITGKQHIESGIKDNFGDEWEKLVIIINESQRALGRGLIKTIPSPLKLQMPISLRNDSGIDKVRKRPPKNSPLIGDGDDFANTVKMPAKNDRPKYGGSGSNPDNRTISSLLERTGDGGDKKEYITDEQRETMEQLFIEAYSKSGGEKKIQVFLQGISGKGSRDHAYVQRNYKIVQNIQNLLQGVQKDRMKYIKFFMRKLDEYGVPPDFFTSDFIQFEHSPDKITIKLRPIFFQCIGKDELNTIGTDIMNSILDLSTHTSHVNTVITYELEVTSW